MARKAQVSIGTVDRVLHKRGRVKPETEKKVLQVIEEEGYRTNIFAKNLKLKKIFNFAVLIPRPEQDSHYWTLPIRGIERARNELASHRIQVKFFFFDRFQEKSVLLAGKKILKENFDGLLAAPVLPRSFGQVLNNLPSDLPFVFFDSYVPGIKPLSFIGQDAFQSGLLSSCLMRQTIHQAAGKIAVVKVLPEDYHIAERINGFLHGVCDFRGFESVVVEINGQATPLEIRHNLETFYQRNRDLAGIFVTNAMTHKVAEWWKAKRSKQRLILLGYDPIPANIKLLKDRTINFLISQQSERQGYEGIYALFRHVVLGEKIRENIMTQIDIIMAENIDYYQS
ncbi:MAG TPA: substrate-binding domain-containing protein [Candidatus Saccharicenans sp.]|nr:substrate-binding domain-containing protein [Candidatus Saccharicenans sp.]HOP60459.1 substrate-binding domain-containing protein [Candidatus Saccharicenans sp.]